MARFVTFLSDYGLQDEFVGTCHGVIKRIAPDVQIVDLTHGIPPQNVLHGALVRITIPEAEVSVARIGATALAVDRFGNVQLNVGRDALGEAGGEPGTRVALDLPAGRRPAVVARTFADAAPGELVVFEDSSGNVSLAVSGGSASATLGLAPGERVWIEIDSR